MTTPKAKMLHKSILIPKDLRSKLVQNLQISLRKTKTTPTVRVDIFSLDTTDEGHGAGLHSSQRFESWLVGSIGQH